LIALIQRVSHAAVNVNGEDIGTIDRGILALIGVEKNDNRQSCKRLAERILSYRVFPDDEDKMNLSVEDIHGGLLLVPQFTLAANTDKGKRPSFSSAASPADAIPLFEELVSNCRSLYKGHIDTGQFGADMQVRLTNDGPVTFWLQAPPK